MKRQRKPEHEKPPVWCGHVDAHTEEFGGRLARVPVGDGKAEIWYVCWQCEGLLNQMQPIPCVGCGGFDPRPIHPGEFNSPVGYYGGGSHRLGEQYAYEWFPWCPQCLQPLAVTCSDCMTADDKENDPHVCGKPLQLASNAAECLWFRYLYGPLRYPNTGIEFRHLLGDRDWYGDVEVAIHLPWAQPLWPSHAAAWEAIEPYLSAHYQLEEAKRIEVERTPVQLGLFGEKVA